MTTPGKDPAAEPGIASLIGGIVGDTKRLVKQHLDLFRHEVREDFRKSKRAARIMAIAHMLALVGCVFVAAMLVGLLVWAVPAVPWWCWSGLVGAALLIVSAAVYHSAKNLLASINPLPDETARVIKEELGWTKNQPPG